MKTWWLSTSPRPIQSQTAAAGLRLEAWPWIPAHPGPAPWSQHKRENVLSASAEQLYLTGKTQCWTCTAEIEHTNSRAQLMSKETLTII